MDTEKTTSPSLEGQAEPAEALHPEIAAELADMEKRMSRLRGMGPQVALAIELEKRFPDNYMSRSIDSLRGEVNISFTFKTTAESAAVLRVLTHEKGLRQKRSAFSNPETKNICWQFPGYWIVGSFSSSEADACKFVQVGTKVVPVFELRCGDKPAQAPNYQQPYPEGMSEADVRSAEAELEGAPF